MPLRSSSWLLTAVVMALGGCAIESPPAPDYRPMTADEGRAFVGQLLPPTGVSDRTGWATDIYAAIASLDIAPTAHNFCAVIAITEQESSFTADPAVPGLAAIAWREIEKQRERVGIPKLVLDGALMLRSADGRSYKERIDAVKTEKQLSEIFEEFIGRVPMGKRFFADRNPVRTGGPMQVSIAFAERHAAAKSYPYGVNGSIRHEVFTRRGGMYFGIAHLLGYRTPYTKKVHRFADFNAGWYASSNAAFQNAVAVANGTRLALDGDLLVPGAPLDKPGETERALRSMAGYLHMDERAIRAALQQGDTLEFNDQPLFREVFRLAEARGGRPLPREMIPGIHLESPKITRELSTAWFATRVDERYRRCLAR